MASGGYWVTLFIASKYTCNFGLGIHDSVRDSYLELGIQVSIRDRTSQMFLCLGQGTDPLSVATQSDYTLHTIKQTYACPSYQLVGCLLKKWECLPGADPGCCEGGSL